MSDDLEQWSDDVVYARLRERLRLQCIANAQVPIDDRLPSPEVFERPGWRTVEKKGRRLEIEIIDGPKIMDKPPEDQLAEMAREPEIEKRTVEPLVTEITEIRGEYRGWSICYGVGIDVPQRLFVHFCWRLTTSSGAR